jgi:hypothetical protein
VGAPRLDGFDGAPLERLVDTGAHSDGEAELATFVEAAVADRPRLGPHAVDRIENRLAELEGHNPARIWRGLRAPAYVLATALVAVVLWAKLSPRIRPEATEGDAGRVARPSVAPAPVRVAAANPLRLDAGSLEVRTDATSQVVQTPRARVEVAPSSTVRVTVTETGVRLAASAGSARILYADGRTELVLPPAPTVLPAVDVMPTHAALHKKATHSALSSAAGPQPDEVAPAPSHGDAERASLLAAMGKLRSAPQEALGLLDVHLQHYPEGLTRPDAERARIAVLLRLSRKPEALEALDHQSALPTDLRVVRAELRVEAQRYEEAIGDFGAVLVTDDDRFAQRALYGRAMARQRQGDRPRMTADLERYLLIYPRGEFADRVRNELRRATSEASR